MKFSELAIEGAWIIEPIVFADDRGIFRRHFCAEEFSAHGLSGSVTQGNISENPNIYTLRGFHFQIAPFAEGKTISCMSGSLFDVIIDLRKHSPTYLKHVAVTISAQDRRSLYVPPGCANAYLTTSENTIVHYYMSEMYEPNSYRGFRFDDPFFKIKWPHQPNLISEKDATFPPFLEEDDD